MAVIDGLVLEGSRSLPEVLAPLADEVSHCYWVVASQTGPFDAVWLYASPEHEARVDRLWWDVPALADNWIAGYCPGTLPALANRLVVDEWSYYFALRPPEDDARRRAAALARHIGDLSEPFLRQLDACADLFLCHVDGWWEFYTGQPDWHRRLRAAWPDCHERPVSQAGSPPGKRRGKR